MAGTLHSLLLRIRDGVATAEELHTARSLVRHDARIPEELREVALAEEPAIEAAALLALIGGDDELGELLRGAVSDEAFDVADAVMAAIDVEPEVEDPEGLAFDVPLAEAIWGEAGWVEVAPVVASVLAIETLPVAEAVRTQAGTVDIVAGVMAEVGEATLGVAEAIRTEAGAFDVPVDAFPGLSLPALPPVADAVRDEAGGVDVAHAVMRDLGLGATLDADLRAAVLEAAGPIDLAGAVMAQIAPPEEVVRSLPRVDVADEPLPTPANRTGWSWGVLAMVAVALLFVGLSFNLGGASHQDARPLQFASAHEIVVEDLNYADDVQVMQAEGDEGALILWIDEEAVL
jgi:hypothetical protein